MGREETKRTHVLFGHDTFVPSFQAVAPSDLSVFLPRVVATAAAATAMSTKLSTYADCVEEERLVVELVRGKYETKEK